MTSPKTASFRISVLLLSLWMPTEEATSVQRQFIFKKETDKLNINSHYGTRGRIVLEAELKARIMRVMNAEYHQLVRHSPSTTARMRRVKETSTKIIQLLIHHYQINQKLSRD